MAKEVYTTVWKSPAGELLLGDYRGRLCLCDWRYRAKRDEIDRRIQGVLGAGYIEGETPLTRAAINQLEEYFAGRRTSFQLPLQLCGTPFQERVWHALLAIEYGSAISYAALSTRMGDPLAIRAVAAANGANAHAIIIPCHRVTGSRGELTGYAGGVAAKKMLLKLEGASGGGQLELF